MNSNRKLTNIVAYYLSRFDNVALSNLKYKTDKDTFYKIVETLGVLLNYILLNRDEFDVAHPHRKDWRIVRCLQV